MRTINNVLRLFSLLLVFTSFLLLSYQVQGAMLGVNRVELRYDDVLRGGYSEKEFVVSIGTPNMVEVFFEARGDIADWISFSPSEIPVLVNADNPASITVIVEPPLDARVDSYQGLVLVTTGALGDISGNMGTTVEAAFELKVFVEITDTQIMKCYVAGMNVKDAEVNFPLEFTATSSNTGNVRIRPFFNFKVFDQFQSEVVLEDSFYYLGEIFPTKTQNIRHNLNLGLNPGQYWLEIEEPFCNSRRTLTFSVLERGGISDEGELVRIESAPWAETNQIIPVNIHFRNIGSRMVSAQFKGIVSKEGRILKVLESDVIDVSAGELEIFNLFYEPEESGQYQISGRVHYNNKLTFEKGTIINVNPSSGSDSGKARFDSVLIFFLIVLVVMFLFAFLILKKKKKKRRF